MYYQTLFIFTSLLCLLIHPCFTHFFKFTQTSNTTSPSPQPTPTTMPPDTVPPMPSPQPTPTTQPFSPPTTSTTQPFSPPTTPPTQPFSPTTTSTTQPFSPTTTSTTQPFSPTTTSTTQPFSPPTTSTTQPFSPTTTPPTTTQPQTSPTPTPESTLNIRPQGGPINVAPINTTNYFGHDVAAWNTNQYVIVWSDGADIQAAIFDFDDLNGTNPRFLAIANNSNSFVEHYPAVSGTSQYFVVVYEVTGEGPDGRIFDTNFNITKFNEPLSNGVMTSFSDVTICDDVIAICYADASSNLVNLTLRNKAGDTLSPPQTIIYSSYLFPPAIDSLENGSFVVAFAGMSQQFLRTIHCNGTMQTAVSLLKNENEDISVSGFHPPESPRFVFATNSFLQTAKLDSVSINVSSNISLSHPGTNPNVEVIGQNIVIHSSDNGTNVFLDAYNGNDSLNIAQYIDIKSGIRPKVAWNEFRNSSTTGSDLRFVMVWFDNVEMVLKAQIYDIFSGSSSVPPVSPSPVPSVPQPLQIDNVPSLNNETSPTFDTVVVPSVVAPLAAVLIGTVVFAILWRRKKKKARKGKKENENGNKESANIYKPMPGPNATKEANNEDNITSDRTKYGALPRKTSTTSFTWEIPYSDLTFGREIGSGSYGKVFEGEWNHTKVAIKVSNAVADIEDFKREAKLMINIPKHPNVLQVFGVSLDGPVIAIVVEYCSGGSLDKFLYNKENEITEEQKYRLISGIASGMYHLSKNNIAHRDLAARNILLSDKGSNAVPRISDFGMSRIISGDGSAATTRTNIGPIRWMAPESLQSKVYSTKSDVWSFGIVVSEIVCRCEPHSGMDLLDVGRQIRDKNLTPEIPLDCDPFLKELMEKCWHRNPDERPTFDEICQWIKAKMKEKGYV